MNRFLSNRGTGRWLTDVSPLLPLLDGQRCTLSMRTDPWAMLWIVSLNLRFSIRSQKSTCPRTSDGHVTGLYDCNLNFNLQVMGTRSSAPSE